MTFQIIERTKAKLLDHDTLSDKNRVEGDEPGLGFNFEMTVPNAWLSLFAPGLREFIYTKTAGQPLPSQQQIEGTAITDLPNLSSIGSHVKRLPWSQEFTGMTLAVLYGNTLYPLENCLVHRFSFQPKEGGSLVMKFRVEAPNVAEKFAGIVPKMKSREVEITLVAPAPKQEEIEPGDQVGQRGADTPPAGAASAPAGEPLTPEAAFLASQRKALRDEKAAGKPVKVTTKGKKTAVPA